ncbi:MAG TPA: response regulator transcription factor [Thermoanaerobaculia bacterium]|jgi:DNA-binding NarL/FixJ family response regulator|nr:response regulator transcription factor [Thermoanaerobaculia bacterium]
MNIVIVDDHSIVRRGLQQIIALRPGWQVVAGIAIAEDVLPTLREHSVDVLVLDVSLGGRSGIDLLSPIRAEFPLLAILMLSMHDEELYAVRCIREGASGYLEKESSPDDLIDAIERVANGQRYVSVAIEEQLGPSGLPHERLTTREFEVLRLIATGMTVSDIAVLLHLSVKTVSTYRTRILEKTGFHSNAELMNYAVRTGLV